METRNAIFTMPSRYRVFTGGRRGGYQRECVRELLRRGREKQIRVFADATLKALIRVQIADSDQAGDYKDSAHTLGFVPTGSAYRFLTFQDTNHMKAMDRVDIAVVARRLSRLQLDILVPTVREPESEIWFLTDDKDETEALMDDLLRFSDARKRTVECQVVEAA